MWGVQFITLLLPQTYHTVRPRNLFTLLVSHGRSMCVIMNKGRQMSLHFLLDLDLNEFGDFLCIKKNIFCTQV